MNRLIVIVGPTASGKTDFAIWLAKEIRTEIISADSLQVYKEFNICTSKPTVEQLEQVDHHLVGHVPICDEYSVVRFVKEARSLIKRISSEGKIPIIVGGTGLYIDALLNNFQFQQDCCENFSENIPNEDLYDTLRSLDPLAAKSIHRNDFKRLRRAINFFKTFNFSILDQKSNTMDAKKEFQVLKFGLNFRDRNLLYGRINKRVDNMLERGLIEEIDRVRKKKISKTAFSAIGYKELLPYFAGEMKLSDSIDKIKQQTRRYAKRQITWFRRCNVTDWIFLDERFDFMSFWEKIKIFLSGDSDF